MTALRPLSAWCAPAKAAAAFALSFTFANGTSLAQNASIKQPTTLPAVAPFSPVVPDGLGVNIHFTDPRPGEMKMLKDAGFSIVRMDFAWRGTEVKAGEYDFAAYERLLKACDEHKLRALFILDYGNKLYDDGLPPHTDAGRAAFAKWAAAAVKHFAGRGVLWEMWNEPNIINFWKPKPSADDYVMLALATGKAIRDAGPRETFIGPATSEIDLAFLESCFKGGLLEYFSAVSVHPYRPKTPETAADDYRKLRKLIAQHAPKGKSIPILSGEWGYSVAWSALSEETQGKYLPRQWLTNLANNVPVSIWYDWHDDGPDAKEAEHNFGTVRHKYNEGRDPVYDAKPAYLAARALTKVLDGYQFNKRLAVGEVDKDYVLLFAKADEPSALPVADLKLVVWTTAKEPRPLVIPVSPGSFNVVDHLGKELPPVKADQYELTVTATDGPLYLTPQKPNDVLRITAMWERAPLDVVLPGGSSQFVNLEVRNPLADEFSAIGATTGGFEPRFIPVSPGTGEVVQAKAVLMRDVEGQAMPVRVSLRFADATVALGQWTHVSVSNPMRVIPLPVSNDVLPLRIENPTGEAFEGRVYVTDVEGELRIPPKRFTMEEGEKGKVLQIPFARGGNRGAYRLGLRVEDRDNNVAVKTLAARFQPIDDFGRFKEGTSPDGWEVFADGDVKVKSEQALKVAPPPDGPLAAGVTAIELKYRFEPGHKFVEMKPTGPNAEAVRKIDPAVKAIGLWIYGDGQNQLARMRFTDAGGQTFQPDLGRISWTGWRYFKIPLDGSAGGGHWGGANDGVVKGPVRLDTLFLLDNVGRHEASGTVYVAAPVLLY